jgi:TRAP-type C4-dicarboxylate transport system permease small subunit
MKSLPAADRALRRDSVRRRFGLDINQGFIAIFFKYALDLMLQTEERTTAFAMSKKWLYACMPVTGGIMVLYSIKNMYFELAGIVKPTMNSQ